MHGADPLLWGVVGQGGMWSPGGVRGRIADLQTQVRTVHNALNHAAGTAPEGVSPQLAADWLDWHRRVTAWIADPPSVYWGSTVDEIELWEQALDRFVARARAEGVPLSADAMPRRFHATEQGTIVRAAREVAATAATGAGFALGAAAVVALGLGALYVSQTMPRGRRR